MTRGERAEINRYIAIDIMGAPYWCEHEDISESGICGKCHGPAQPMPDYCSDESKRQLLRAAILHWNGHHGHYEFGRQLEIILGEVARSKSDGRPPRYLFALATGEQLATALVEAHKAKS